MEWQVCSALHTSTQCNLPNFYGRKLDHFWVGRGVGRGEGRGESNDPSYSGLWIETGNGTSFSCPPLNFHVKSALAPLPDPTTKRWRAKWKLGRNTHASHARLCTFGAPDLHAPSVLVNKVSASELSRKFTKSAPLVGFEKRRRGIA